MTNNFPAWSEALQRHAIGLDNLRHWANAELAGNLGNYPPHDIEKLSDDHYRITMALAGFGGDEVTVTLHNGLLTIAGKPERDRKARNYLHHGIACREFERQFWLDSYVEVKAARLDGGLLTVDLERVVPEAHKPKQIPVLAN